MGESGFTPANPAEARGVLGSPFDLAEIEIEQAPRGPVTLMGFRAGQRFSGYASPGEWKIIARPQVPEALLASYHDGMRLVAAKEIEKGTKTWQAVADKAQLSNDPVLRYWISLRVADVLSEARRWDEADAAYRKAMEQGTIIQQPALFASGWEKVGAGFQKHNDWSGAEAAYRQALQIRREHSAVSLGVAHDLNLLGVWPGRGAIGDRPDRSTSSRSN